MKKLFLLLSFICLFSCKKEQKTVPDENGIPIVVSESKMVKPRIFPLKGFSKIELISYFGDRTIWDTIGSSDKNFFYKELVVKSKLNFDSTFIKERVVLNKVQQKELLSLIVCDTCEPQEIASACYMPRHLILFRDNKDRIIAYNEFCFGCIGARYSENLRDYQKFCLIDMNALFKKFGIKYFVDSNEQEREENRFLDSIQKARWIK